MEKQQNIWGILAITYFFLAGTAAMIGLCFAGATLLSSNVIDMFSTLNISFSETLGVSISKKIVAPLIVALVLAGLGGCCLLMELSQKFRFPYVYANPKSLMAIGAYSLSGFMGTAFLLIIVVLVPTLRELSLLRNLTALLLALSSIVLVVYPALEMAEARGRSFWGAGLVPLFTLSALSCAIAVINLWGSGINLSLVLVIYLVALIAYLWTANLSGKRESRRAVDLLLKDGLKPHFLGGAVGVGIVIPLILYLLTQNVLTHHFANIMVVIGGFCFRYTFMKAGLRAELPGEYETRYTDEELAALGHSLNARWIEKADITNGK